MTAIGAILKDGQIAIVSDMMVSAPFAQSGCDEIFIPTGTVCVKDLNEMHPISLAQKTIIINPNLAFSWAGRLIFGSWCCAHLREKYGDKEHFDEIIMQKMLSEISPECTAKDAFMIMTFDPKRGYSELKQLGGWWGQIEDVCDMMLAGNGGTHIYEAAERLTGFKSLGAAHWSMALVSRMIDREAASGTSTIACYGGAWDITYLSLDGFKKLEPIVYSQWEIEKYEDTYTYAISCLFGTRIKSDRIEIKALVGTKDNDIRFIYMSAFPPDVREAEKVHEIEEFILDFPNQVITLRYQPKNGKPVIVTQISALGSENERPFRETSSNPHNFEYAVKLSLFDEFFEKIRDLD